MRAVITEKNIAARKIAELLALGKPKTMKVGAVPAYSFERDGDEWVAIGLKGHILEVGFPDRLVHQDGSWQAVWPDGSRTPAQMPASLPTPPWEVRSRPFTKDGVDLKTWKVAALPYLVWAPIGKVPTEPQIIDALRTVAAGADEIIVATDFDREGELIGADAARIVREVNARAPIRRARYSAITKEEIEHAFANLTSIDEHLAEAGGTRQDIDLAWGAVLTRFLTTAKFSGYGNVKSAGRVQTPTLALIVEREREREAHVPETYWQVKAQAEAQGERFAIEHAGNNFTDRAEAERAFAAVEHAEHARVVDVATTRRSVQPPAPFNTTALQAAAAAEGLSPARTMRIAESLYMNGLISYPRVDNTVYPASLDLSRLVAMLAEVPAYREHARALLSVGELRPTRGKQETTDHPPIHPTGAADPDTLKPEEWKLYNLIARRYLATLSEPAVVEATKVRLDVAGEPFVAKGEVLAVPGFRAIYPYGLKKDEQLPRLSTGEVVDILDPELIEKQTEPPKRYSQGALIQEMEKRGLGTKATRHATIERLYQVNYIEGDPIEPTCLGRAVIDTLTRFAPRITTPEMTAELEVEMDDIANGRATREAVVGHSRALLADVVDELLPKAAELGAALREATTEDAKVGVCPKSGHDLLVKRAKRGTQFVGCSGWPECDVAYPVPDGRIEAVPDPCPECGTPQIRVVRARTKPLVRCLDPACPTNAEATIDIGACPVCASEGRADGRLIAQRSRNLKRFARCTNYELCKTSYPLPARGDLEPTGETCEPCGAPVVVVRTSRGPWRICVDPACPAKAEAAEQRSAKRGRRTARATKR